MIVLEVEVMARDHFVPRFYLKNFAIKEAPKSVFRYRRGLERDQRNIKKVASQEDYYTVTLTATGEKSDQFEKMFSRLESDTALIVRRLISEHGPIRLSKTELITLSNFIAFLHLRGPAFRIKMHNIDAALFVEYINEITADIESFRKAANRMKLEINSDDDLEQEFQKVSGVADAFKEKQIALMRESGEEGLVISQMMKVAKELFPLIFYRHWHIYESRMSGVFITSDNPVLMMALDLEPHTEGEIWEKGIIVLPISPSRCLALSPGNVSHTVPVSVIDFGQLQHINEAMMFHAVREVYAHYSSAWLKKLFDRTKEGESFELLNKPKKEDLF